MGLGALIGIAQERWVRLSPTKGTRGRYRVEVNQFSPLRQRMVPKKYGESSVIYLFAFIGATVRCGQCKSARVGKLVDDNV